MNASSSWFIYQNNERLGPFILEDLRQKIMQQQIHPQAFAYTDGYTDWVPLSQVEQFSDLFPQSEDTSEKTIEMVNDDAATEAIWSLFKNNTTLGPFTDQQIKDMLARREVSPEDSIWREGWPDWVSMFDTADWKPIIVKMGLSPPPQTADYPARKPSAEDTLPLSTTSKPAPKRFKSMKQIQHSAGRFNVRSFIRLVLFITFIGLVGYGAFMNKDKIMEGVQMVMQKWKEAGPPGTATTTTPQIKSSSTQSTPSTPSVPILSAVLNQVQGEVGFSSQSLFSDSSVFLARHKPTAHYVFIAYSQADPLFSVSPLASSTGISLTPPLPQAGPTNLMLIDTSGKTPTVVAEKSISVALPSPGPKLNPLPERTEALRKQLTAIQSQYKLLVKASKGLKPWSQTQENIRAELTQSARALKECLGIYHLPKACAHLSQMAKDAVDYHHALGLIMAKATPKTIQAKVGRPLNQIQASFSQTQKIIETFIEAPKAVETVEAKDILQWLENVNSIN